jgi:hypothetical protein
LKIVLNSGLIEEQDVDLKRFAYFDCVSYFTDEYYPPTNVNNIPAAPAETSIPAKLGPMTCISREL